MTEPSVRAQVRAGALALAIGLQLVVASPLARSVDEDAAKRDLAKDEMHRIGERLRGVGIGVTDDRLMDLSLSGARAGVVVRDALTGWFKPFMRVTGTGQNWGLFSYPDRFPVRLLVEGRTADRTWKRLYASLDPEHAWMADTLTYRRIRGVYDGVSEKGGGQWRRFAQWLDARALHDFPEISEARSSFVRIHTHEPGDVLGPIVEEHKATNAVAVAR